ncbi:MAG: hypothetical protein V2I97_07790, partial [Desulfococcaceae bacterium]|nr:hypothetical protein [Desulfococcaceae bacterium]
CTVNPEGTDFYFLEGSSIFCFPFFVRTVGSVSGIYGIKECAGIILSKPQIIGMVMMTQMKTSSFICDIRVFCASGSLPDFSYQHF